MIRKGEVRRDLPGTADMHAAIYHDHDGTAKLTRSRR
jgi:hypothetical protein